MTILTFFLPFLAVSCGNDEFSISMTGAEIAFGKKISGFDYNGNPAALILIIPPAVLLILSFFISKSKRVFLMKNIFLIAPLSDIFSAFVIRYAAQASVMKRLNSVIPADNLRFGAQLVHVKYGFILYIVFNAVVFLSACINYFIKREWL